MILHHLLPAFIKLASLFSFMLLIMPELEEDYCQLLILLYTVFSIPLLISWIVAACSDSRAASVLPSVLNERYSLRTN